VTLTFGRDSFDRVTCLLRRGAVEAVATASNRSAAIDEMLAAMASLDANGLGECFWHEAAGEYRWVFRREDDKVRVAVLWSAGVMTGWEHVFWAECAMDDVMGQIRTGLDQIAI
jgi:hypothetical protein